jgi:hypothetical protein
MALVTISGGQSFLKALKEFEAQTHAAFFRMLTRFAVDMNELVLAKTPVWEGDTVRNWHWSLGGPSMRHDDPVAEPDDPSEGGTPPSRIALGAEPRRSANEDAQREEFAEFLMELSMNAMPSSIWLTNTADTAIDLEYGLIGKKAPQGMLRVSLAETLMAIGAV